MIKPYKLTPILFLSLNVILTILILSVGCSKKEKSIQIVPGKSIAGLELGMLKEQVASVLGTPSFQFFKEDMDKFGGVYDITPEGKYERVPLKEMENTKLLIYLEPPLSILIDENNKVSRLSLNYCENVVVKGYPFLKFVYLTQEELNRLGEPTSIYRAKEAEMKMVSKAPKGTIYEYYEYFYDSIGMNLGLVFDRSKQKSSNYFIGVNHIDIYYPKK